jgi:hypothetical protein
MCILIHHPANTTFSYEQLLDFYSKNPDGFGAIVKRGDSVEVIKSIGNMQEIEDLYNDQVAGNEAIIHFRMKTHGAIDIANCHPYEVVPGIWMAHNGILSTGNKEDPKMSDTWHYIQNFLKPMLQENPNLIFNPGFQDLIANHIGYSNKFAFMNQDGDSVIINKSSGVVHDDVWYSNTYAWTPYKFGYGKPPAPVKPYTPSAYTPNSYQPKYPAQTQSEFWDSRYASSSTWREWDRMDREMQAKPAPAQVSKKTKQRKKRSKSYEAPKLSTEQFKRLIRNSYNAVQLGGFQGALDWIDNSPMSAMRFIYEIYGNERNSIFNAAGISKMVNEDVGEAADLICEIWEEMEPELCALADIKLEGVTA